MERFGISSRTLSEYASVSQVENGYASEDQEEDSGRSWLRASLSDDRQPCCEPTSTRVQVVAASLAASLIIIGLVAKGNRHEVYNSLKSSFPWIVFLVASTLLLPAAIPMWWYYDPNFSVCYNVKKALIKSCLKWKCAIEVLMTFLPMIADLGLDSQALEAFYADGDFQYFFINLLAIVFAIIWASTMVHQAGFRWFVVFFTLTLCLPAGLLLLICWHVVTAKSESHFKYQMTEYSVKLLITALTQAEGLFEGAGSSYVQAYKLLREPPMSVYRKTILIVSSVSSVIMLAKAYAMIDNRGHVSRRIGTIPIVVGSAWTFSIPFGLVCLYRLASILSRGLLFIFFQEATRRELNIFSIPYGAMSLVALDTTIQVALVWKSTENGTKLWYAVANTLSAMEPLLNPGPPIWTTDISWHCTAHFIEETVALLFLLSFRGSDEFFHHFADNMLYVWAFGISLAIKYPLILIIRRCCTYAVSDSSEIWVRRMRDVVSPGYHLDTADLRARAGLVWLGLDDKLDLQGCCIEDRRANLLADLIIEDPCIKHVYLQKNDIADDGAIALSFVMQRHISIIDLGLEYNQISDIGARALADGIKRSNSISWLSLVGNNITDAGVKALADGIRQNSSIVTLGLASNRIGDDGAIALADAIKKENSTIKELLLSGNNICDDGAIALAEGSKQSVSVQWLRLDDNKIGDASRAQLSSYERPGLKIFARKRQA